MSNGYRKARRLSFERFEPRMVLTAAMVYDFNTRPLDSSPGGLTPAVDTVFFVATPHSSSNELWKTDGTEDGTVRLSGQPSYISTHSMTTLGDRLFFFAGGGGGTNQELWVSDGSTVGTRFVTNVTNNHGLTAYFGDRGRYTAFQGNYYFAGSSTVFDPVQLWRSDGTAFGTRQVSHITPLNIWSNLGLLTPSNNLLFFVAEDDSHGYEVWKTDGTPEGTSIVADIREGAASSNPFSLTVVGNSLYFFADDGKVGYSLWRSDGTAAGTVRLAATPGWNYNALTAVGSTLYFNLGNQLWKTDGTVEGTQLVATIPNTRTGVFLEFTSLRDNLIFIANDDIHGFELWRSDGTNQGTHLLKDLYPGSYPGPFNYVPHSLTRVGESIFLVGDVSDLWQTDGTEGGTHLVTTFDVLNSYTLPSELTSLGSTLLVVADEAVVGNELWRSDGTKSGTTVIKDISVGTKSSSARVVGRVGDHLYVEGDSNPFVTDVKLWTIGDSTPPQFVTDVGIIGFATTIHSWTSFADRFYYVARYGLPNALMETDGTTAGSHVIKSGFWVSTVRVAGSRMFLSGNDGGLWVSDGTTNGTVELLRGRGPDIETPPNNLVTLGNNVLFTYRSELWRSDGTAEGTAILKKFIDEPGTLPNSSNLKNLVVIDDVVYFTSGRELWRTDGTAAGTVRLKQFGSNHFVTKPANLIAKGAVLFFTADDALWKSDGSELGTVMIKKLPGYVVDLTLVGSKLFFTSPFSDPFGRELWVSDGTSAGTMPVTTDMWSKGGAPTRLTAVGETLYFVADDGQSGLELWKTDGTVAGTALFQDVYPGTRGSNPENLTVDGDTLYFTANDGFHGKELWVLRPDLIPGDFDKDHDVDSADLLDLLANWTGTLEPNSGGKDPSTGDIDGDADVDSVDLLEFLAHWTGSQNAERARQLSVVGTTRNAVSSQATIDAASPVAAESEKSDDEPLIPKLVDTIFNAA